MASAPDHRTDRDARQRIGATPGGVSGYVAEVMRIAVLVLVAACGSSGNGDVVGPYTGTIQRYTVDTLTLPTSDDQVHAFGDDLDGNGTIDNALGNVVSALISVGDGSTHAADMIAAGTLASSVDIQADDLTDDDTVAVDYRGSDGDNVVVAGGKFIAGVFSSNRTRTTHVPGEATVRLPILESADPVDIDLKGVEIDLQPDGAGGFTAIIRGGILIADAQAAAYASVARMLLDDPHGHLQFARTLDSNDDGQITSAEIAGSALLGSLLQPDIQLFDGTQFAPNPKGTARDSMSIGFSVHLTPCASGQCSTATPGDTCTDRVRDDNETDVDCGGGTCMSCGTAAACAVPADCQSNACDTGHCRAPTCSDGVRDGFESDVDCGAACPQCAVGQMCAIPADCASGKCSAAGTCGS